MLVGKPHPDANLFQPPPPYSRRGRPRVKDGRLPKPREAVENAAPESRSAIVVPCCGSGRRNVAVQAGAGHWFKAGCGLVHHL